MKTFSLSAVLSVSTGVLFQEIGGLYEILNYMTDDTLFTHQLPRASDECRPYLFRQYPDLKSVDTSSVDGTNYKEFLAQQEKKFGTSLEIDRIPKDDHDQIDPYDEMVQIRGTDENIIIVDGPPKEV